MTKTLRVLEREGWETKPAPDLDENRLTAEEIDENFLALEDDKVDKVDAHSLVADTEIAKIHSQNTDTNLGALSIKDPVIDADLVVSRDSEDDDKLKTSTWAQIKAFLGIEDKADKAPTATNNDIAGLDADGDL